MQDFNYLFSNCFEITVELSCCKYPHRDILNGEWLDNVESMIGYLEQVHKGVKGLVVDKHGKPVENAAVEVEGIAKKVFTTDRGEYWRLLPTNKAFRLRATKGSTTSEWLDVRSSQPATIASDIVLNDVSRTDQHEQASSSLSSPSSSSENGGNSWMASMCYWLPPAMCSAAKTWLGR